MKSYDPEEQEIIAALDAGELRSTHPGPELRELYRGYARNTINKDKRVNIRLSARDLEDIKIRAMEEGMPYQTLMSSILHKYVSGRLIEKTSG